MIIFNNYVFQYNTELDQTKAWKKQDKQHTFVRKRVDRSNTSNISDQFWILYQWLFLRIKLLSGTLPDKNLFLAGTLKKVLASKAQPLVRP